MLRILKHSEYLPVQTVVTVGKFDGFHLGHRRLLAEVLNEAKNGLASCVISFSTTVDCGRKMIYTKEEQRKLCESMGVDILAEYPLDESLREMTAEQFVSEILCKRLQAKVIVAGEDFRFGKDRAGDVKLLQSLENRYDYRTVIVPKVTDANVRISSTGIRELLGNGNVSEAMKRLGSPYVVFGEVLHGKKLGRSLGFPTMNLIPSPEKLLPAYGVYVTKTKVDGQWFDGITNIGLRPTVDSDHRVSVETYLFSYDGDLYGKQVEVHFFSFLRPERKFSDVEQLKSAMREDFANAKAYLKKM
ncbi:MAG: bifunctional riboflavin kinase/FAD synthetase [Lachnospiraceae bacterium]|nr:bifunctional riboflavin kinase/FAD synthetase [Lachnospiraceae bacterium]